MEERKLNFLEEIILLNECLHTIILQLSPSRCANDKEAVILHIEIAGRKDAHIFGHHQIIAVAYSVCVSAYGRFYVL